MSDEKRREELKAKINEQLDKLSIEDLENVAGGAEWVPERDFHRTCEKCGAVITVDEWLKNRCCPVCGEPEKSIWVKHVGMCRLNNGLPCFCVHLHKQIPEVRISA